MPTKINAFVSMLALLAFGGGALAGPPRPATDEEIQRLIADAGDADDFDKADIVYVLDEDDVYVQDSGLATTERCQVIKILTDEGVRSQSLQRFDFDPDTTRITVRSVRIHRKNGSVEEVPLSTLITQPSKQWMIYWGGQQHLLSLPRLDVGDSIEIRISKIGFNIAYLADGPARTSGSGSSTATEAGGETLIPPMLGHWYEVTLFQRYVPILKKRYSVHMPKDKPVQYEVYNGALKSSLWFDGDRHVYTWTAEDIPSIKKEPHMVALDDCATKLVMATLSDWQQKSQWFHEVNETQFEADDAIRKKVRELTAGMTDPEEKVAACVHWVADNVRYNGTKRGPCEGFTLHRSIETFRDRGGVCKDKAGMLVTMLRVLGRETYPALTMAGSRVEAIPADQFNHTVTVMRNPDGTFRVLDPTWAPQSRELWSSREALQGLVYGTPEGQTLTLSPYFDPAYNSLTVHSQGSIGEDGTLTTRITMDLHGYPCTYLRRSIGRHAKGEQRAALEEAMHIAPNARLDHFEFTDPYDYSRDGRVVMKISAERYAAGGDGVQMFRLPLMSHPLSGFFIPDLFYPVDAEHRTYGLRLRATRRIVYEETLNLPRGWSVVSVPESKTLDSPSASLSFEATSDESTLSYRFEFALKKQIIPAEDYEDYRAAIQKMKDISKEWIVCRTGGGDHGLAKGANSRGAATGGTK